MSAHLPRLTPPSAIAILAVGHRCNLRAVRRARAARGGRPPTPIAAAAPQSVGMSQQRLGRITTAFNKEIADKKLPAS